MAFSRRISQSSPAIGASPSLHVGTMKAESEASCVCGFSSLIEEDEILLLAAAAFPWKMLLVDTSSQSSPEVARSESRSSLSFTFLPLAMDNGALVSCCAFLLLQLDDVVRCLDELLGALDGVVEDIVQCLVW